jgi:ribonuclease P protein component
MRGGRAAASVFPPDPARGVRPRKRETMNEPEARASAGSRAAGRAAQIKRLKRRSDFQRAARGRRARMEAFALQSNRRPAPPAGQEDRLGARVGFTVTKKLGDAVVRNRIRRRLKEALRLAPSLETRPDHDYVVMAQPEALKRRFDLLQADLASAFALVHSNAARPSKDRDKRR